jgi:cobalt-zinc-cadmium efflux system outer membrane protein
MELFKVEGNLDRARLAAADERARLGSLMGIAGWRDDWETAGELPPLPGADPDAGAEEAAAMGRRFDLLAARKWIDMRLRRLATQRRFRWLTQFEIGVFRDKAIGGTPFTGPTVAFELPVFDQRQAALLEADAQLRLAVRQLEAAALEARRQIRAHAGTLAATRRIVERYQQDVLPGHERLAASTGAGHAGELSRLNGRLTLLEAQREHVAALRDYWVARSALAHAAGDWLGVHGNNPWVP